MTRRYVRVATRRKDPVNEEISDRIGGNETTPGSVGALTEGLTEPPTEEGVTAVAQSTDQRRRLAGEFLLRARDDFDRAARTRLDYILNARLHGLTYGEIGTFLGVTEGAVRYIVKNHGGDD